MIINDTGLVHAAIAGSWSFVGSNDPVRNESMMNGIYEMNHKCGGRVERSESLRPL